MEENRKITSNDKLPGCERLTRPEEIKGLSKFLGAVKETQETWLEDNMATENYHLDTADGYDPIELPGSVIKLDKPENPELPTGTVKLREGDEVISLPDSILVIDPKEEELKTDIVSLEVPDEKLKTSRIDIDVKEVSDLPKEKEDLSVNDRPDLPKTVEKLHNNYEVSSLPDSIIGLDVKKPELKTGISKLKVDHVSELPQTREDIKPEDVKSLGNYLDSLFVDESLELPKDKLDLEKQKLPPLPTDKEKINPREPELRQSREDLIDKRILDLPDERLDIKPGEVDLPNNRDDLKGIPDVSLPTDKVELDEYTDLAISKMTADELYKTAMKLLVGEGTSGVEQKRPDSSSIKLAGILSANLGGKELTEEGVRSAAQQLLNYFTTQRAILEGILNQNEARGGKGQNPKASNPEVVIPTSKLDISDNREIELPKGVVPRGDSEQKEDPDKSISTLTEKMPPRVRYTLSDNGSGWTNLSTYDQDRYIRKLAEMAADGSSDVWGNANPSASGWGRKVLLETTLRALVDSRRLAEVASRTNRDRLPGGSVGGNLLRKAVQGGIGNSIQGVLNLSSFNLSSVKNIVTGFGKDGVQNRPEPGTPGTPNANVVSAEDGRLSIENRAGWSIPLPGKITVPEPAASPKLRKSGRLRFNDDPMPKLNSFDGEVGGENEKDLPRNYPNKHNDPFVRSVVPGTADLGDGTLGLAFNNYGELKGMREMYDSKIEENQRIVDSLSPKVERLTQVVADAESAQSKALEEHAQAMDKVERLTLNDDLVNSGKQEEAEQQRLKNLEDRTRNADNAHRDAVMKLNKAVEDEKKAQASLDKAKTALEKAEALVEKYPKGKKSAAALAKAQKTHAAAEKELKAAQKAHKKVGGFWDLTRLENAYIDAKYEENLVKNAAENPDALNKYVDEALGDLSDKEMAVADANIALSNSKEELDSTAEEMNLALQNVKDLKTMRDTYMGINLGLKTTLDDLCPYHQEEIYTLEDFRKAISESPYMSSPSKYIKSWGESKRAPSMSLDTNAYWELIVEPLVNKELNGGYSYLPSIYEINNENLVEHGIDTYYSRWIPATNVELQKTKMTTKSLGLFDGEITYPISVEYTNDLRITIVDDQYKSWRRYFQKCMEVSIYNSEAHDIDWYNNNSANLLQRPTAIDKTKFCAAFYKNVTFRIRLYFMTPQYSTIKKYDLLCVLKDFVEEYSGETDSGASDLNIAFSIVGENPEINTIIYDEDISEVKSTVEVEKEGKKSKEGITEKRGGWVYTGNKTVQTTTLGGFSTDADNASKYWADVDKAKEAADTNNKGGGSGGGSGSGGSGTVAGSDGKYRNTDVLKYLESNLDDSDKAIIEDERQREAARIRGLMEDDAKSKLNDPSWVESAYEAAGIVDGVSSDDDRRAALQKALKNEGLDEETISKKSSDEGNKAAESVKDQLLKTEYDRVAKKVNPAIEYTSAGGASKEKEEEALEGLSEKERQTYYLMIQRNGTNGGAKSGKAVDLVYGSGSGSSGGKTTSGGSTGGNNAKQSKEPKSTPVKDYVLKNTVAGQSYTEARQAGVGRLKAGAIAIISALAGK